MDRTVKACCLRPSDDEAYREATLALARQVVRRGQGQPQTLWFRMALGMAEYRSGHDDEAQAALFAAADEAKGNANIFGTISNTSALYRAMSLYRQGREAEARRVATETASRMRALPADENRPLIGGANADDFILWLAYREAKALIGFEAAPAPRAQSWPRLEKP